MENLIFYGHWQNPYLNKQQKIILEAISKNKIVKDMLASSAKPGSTVLHVRRGDYLKINEELKESFYTNAIQAGKDNIENFHYSVFTDDYEWVVSCNIFNDAEKIIESSNSTNDTFLEDFAEMLTYENFIVGNSTFSLVPALLSDAKNKIIIIADPWYRNTKINIDVPGALKIKNQLPK